MMRYVPFLVLLAMTAFGAWFVYLGINLGITAQRQKSWPAIEGIIIESSASQYTYEYRVGGSKHRGVRYGEFARDANPRGAAVTVYYDPANPAEAVLYREDHISTLIVTGCGIALVLLCFPFLVFYGALLYCDIMLIKMRYHLRKGLEALEEGDALVNAIYEERGYVPDELANKQQDTLAKAAAAGAMLREIEDLLPAKDDDAKDDEEEKARGQSLSGSR